MTTGIHPSACVEDGARIDPSAVIGAFAYVGAAVQIGANCVLHHHATVEGATVMGCGNEVFPYAYIGAKTHDLKHVGGVPRLVVGDRNVFREYTSVHLATADGDATVIGDDNVILAYSHIAHDCHVGDHMIMSSHAALGGHVLVGDHVNVGWGVGIHQFCSIGSYAMLGAASKVVQDVPPFMIADGNPAAVRTVNRVGLERCGFSNEYINTVRRLYRILYRSGLNRSQAVDAIRQSSDCAHGSAQSLLAFIEVSERGLA